MILEVSARYEERALGSRSLWTKLSYQKVPCIRTDYSVYIAAARVDVTRSSTGKGLRLVDVLKRIK